MLEKMDTASGCSCEFGRLVSIFFATPTLNLEVDVCIYLHQDAINRKRDGGFLLGRKRHSEGPKKTLPSHHPPTPPTRRNSPPADTTGKYWLDGMVRRRGFA